MNNKILLTKIGENRKHADRVTVPPMGVSYLASTLIQSGFSVQILDMKVENMGPKDVALRVKDEAPSIVGLSVLTIDAKLMLDTAHEIKKLSPQVKVMVGGPHATVHYNNLALEPDIDVAVIGEGERTVTELVPALLNGGDLHSIQGIAFKNGDSAAYTGPRAPIEDLDSLPFPALELLKLSEYYKAGSFAPLGPRKYLPIFTSRGCPYHCAYCHRIFGKKFRPRSPENVVSEIKHLKTRFGINEFEILDDIFNLNKERMHNILDQIIEQKLNIKFAFPNGLRGDRLDEESIVKLKKAGAIQLSFAVESASPRIQKLIKKNNNLEKIAENIEIAYRNKIYTNGFFMMGFPSETEEEVQLTIDFALKSKLNQAEFFLVIPFENTELWEIAKKHTKIPLESYYEQEFHNNQFDLSEVGLERLHQLHREAFRKFFLSFGRLISLVIRHPRKRNLLKYISVFARRSLKI